MRVLFATEHGKFNVHSKDGKKMLEKFYGFSDNFISIGMSKFCKILPEILVVRNKRVIKQT